jgi:hypothetical protein
MTAVEDINFDDSKSNIIFLSEPSLNVAAADVFLPKIKIANDRHLCIMYLRHDQVEQYCSK